MPVSVSVVMPCLNERETVGTCIRKARDTLNRLSVEGEIIVADNGSTDGSVEVARSLGARVVHESRRGYGNAYRAGIDAACGQYIVVADSDDSYDFTDLQRFLEPLKNGTDFVIGSRLKGRIERGAMPWLHRYVGNPLLTHLLNTMYRTSISDAHCGMRSFTREAYEKMDLQTTGMEFASEMVIRAAQKGLSIKEIPIVLYRDGRSRPPHLRSFRDGWRHLRFMLLHSPTHLYIWPGTFLFTLGMAMVVLLLPGPLTVAGRIVDVHVMVLGSLLAVLGFQIINTGFYARIYAATHGYLPQDTSLERLFHLFNLERGVILGAALFLIGFGVDLYILLKWIASGFGPLSEVRPAVLASTLIIIGAQIVFSSFFLSMLGIERRPFDVEKHGDPDRS